MKLKPKNLEPFIARSLVISELTDKELNMFSGFKFISDGHWKFDLKEIRKREYLILDTRNLMVFYNCPSHYPIISFKEVLKSVVKIQNKMK